jgi:acylphosphatase
MMGEGRITRHVIVSGRVQGVGFRAWVELQALQRGIAGWVRNRYAGTVEAVFVGSALAVEAMIAACDQGPASARVERVEAREATAEELAAVDRSGFVSLPTV